MLGQGGSQDCGRRSVPRQPWGSTAGTLCVTLCLAPPGNRGPRSTVTQVPALFEDID